MNQKRVALACAALAGAVAAGCGGAESGMDGAGMDAGAEPCMANVPACGVSSGGRTPVTPGTGGTGGTGGAGGAMARGGTAGSGDVRSGGGAAVGDATGGQTPITTGCTIDVAQELSPAIPTVGIVTWSTDLTPVDAATIEFGLDTGYGMEAPADLDEPNHRTLLLGMVESTEYHFRVVIRAGDRSCASQDYSLTTGSLDGGGIAPQVNTPSAGEVSPGFLVTSVAGGAGGGGGGGGGSRGLIAIYNQEGALVWRYSSPIAVISRARMSYDAKSIIARDGNPTGSGAGQAVRVSMDGLQEEPLSVPNGHHDFAATPDGPVFIRKAPDNCDELARLFPDGSLDTIYTISAAFNGNVGSGGDPCHANSVQYNEVDDSFTVSVLNLRSYVKVTAAGQLVWVLGGNTSHFSGDGTQWNNRQHGHHMLDPSRILFFNNDAGGGSAAVEVALDLANMTATRVWSYESGRASGTLGDVQRLPNGNTLVVYSNQGVVHEVNAQGQLVQEITWTGGIGYMNHRRTLYGLPPR